jgi:hypothetical protein
MFGTKVSNYGPTVKNLTCINIMSKFTRLKIIVP